METPPQGGASRVLVVDDDLTVAEVVSGYLERAGYAVDRAEDGHTALERAAARRPDLVVLDLMLPGIDGLEVCRRLRARGPVPVIMLTARGDEDDRILGLEIGADDYVTKPFSPRELVLRVESVLRRTGSAAGGRTGAVLSAAGLTVDPPARRATKHGTELALTVREFDLLVFFMRHPGRAFDREELMREVWGWDFGDLSTVTVHVRRLRGKIEDDPARPRLIQTVWGVGYRLAVSDGVASAGVASDATDPEATASAATASHTADSNATASRTAALYAAAPYATALEVVAPEATASAATASHTADSNATASRTAALYAAAPYATALEVVAPEAVARKAADAEAVAREAAVPEAAAPEGGAREMAAPEAAAPERGAPEAAAPEAAAPERGAPEAAAPEAAAPERGAPERGAPEVAAPEAAAPARFAPEAAAAEGGPAAAVAGSETVAAPHA